MAEGNRLAATTLLGSMLAGLSSRPDAGDGFAMDAIAYTADGVEADLYLPSGDVFHITLVWDREKSP